MFRSIFVLFFVALVGFSAPAAADPVVKLERVTTALNVHSETLDRCRAASFDCDKLDATAAIVKREAAGVNFMLVQMLLDADIAEMNSAYLRYDIAKKNFERAAIQFEAAVAVSQ